MSSPPAHITLDVINDLFESHVRSKVANLQRLDLLSALESLANDLFSTHEAFASHRNAFGSDPESVQSTVHSTVACLWDRIEDGSPDFYTAVEVTTARSRLVTGLILRSLRAFSGAGFNDFERLLVENSASLCVLYDIWYKSWNRAVRKPDVVNAIESSDRTKLPSDFLDHHTIIHFNSAGELVASSYFDYFPEELGPIIGQLTRTIELLRALDPECKDWAEPRLQHIRYFEMYRDALAERDVSKLAQRWEDLDAYWVGIHFWIQVVHEQEFGYSGEPLRTKVAPDHAFILVDERHASHNALIETTKKVMLDYLEERKSKGDKLAIPGLHCLRSSFASINYIPFACGASAQFRWVGSSLPNNTKVRCERGCKIYSNPAASGGAVKLMKKCIQQTVIETQWQVCSEAYQHMEFLALFVSPHEYAHAVYDLGSDHLKMPSEPSALLEEPRAELTAVLTLRLLLKAGIVDQKQMERLILAFAVHDFRYLSFATNSNARAYTISAIYHFTVYEQTGYISYNQDGKVVFDLSKSSAVLNTLADLCDEMFSRIEAADTPWLLQLLETMEKQTEGTTKLIKVLTNSH